MPSFGPAIPRARALLPYLALASAMALAVALSLTGCGASFNASSRIVRTTHLAFRVGALPSEWTRVALAGDRVVFHHAHGGTIAASGNCNGGEDAPLEVLANHLVFGVEPRRVLTTEALRLDDRGALLQQIEGSLDGVPVAMTLVVLKKDGCVFDLTLVGARDAVARRGADFRAFFRDFQLVAVTR